MLELKLTTSVFRSLTDLYCRILLNKIHCKNKLTITLLYGQNLFSQNSECLYLSYSDVIFKHVSGNPEFLNKALLLVVPSSNSWERWSICIFLGMEWSSITCCDFFTYIYFLFSKKTDILLITKNQFWGLMKNLNRGWCGSFLWEIFSCCSSVKKGRLYADIFAFCYHESPL